MRWYQRFFRRGLTEKRLDAELRFHLEQQIADYISAEGERRQDLFQWENGVRCLFQGPIPGLPASLAHRFPTSLSQITFRRPSLLPKGYLKPFPLAALRVSSAPKRFQSTPLRRGERRGTRWRAPTEAFRSMPRRGGQQRYPVLGGLEGRPYACNSCKTIRT
jgi:hypothetical protein